jgi:pyrophosphatase PpaX
MNFTHIFFDMDGTLVDTWELYYLAFRHVSMKFTGRDITRNDVKKRMSEPLEDQLGEIGTERGTEMTAEFLSHYFQNNERMVRAYDGTRELLVMLRDHGFGLGIVTTKMRLAAEQELRVCGMDSFFTRIVGYEDTPRKKPDPGPVLAAAGHFRVNPSSCLMVGDSKLDVLAARGAGAMSAGALWGTVSRDDLVNSGPDYLLERPMDLLRALGI